MPKKNKKKKNKKPRETVKRELVFKRFQEEYAMITKKLGDRRMLVKMPGSNVETMAIIPGRFRKRCWFNIDDLCLISQREFQDSKVDIVYKYTAEEARELCRMGEIPAQFASANAAETLAEDETGMTDAFEFSFDEI
jgi:initiation factor 1A